MGESIDDGTHDVSLPEIHATTTASAKPPTKPGALPVAAPQIRQPKTTHVATMGAAKRATEVQHAAQDVGITVLPRAGFRTLATMIIVPRDRTQEPAQVQHQTLRRYNAHTPQFRRTDSNDRQCHHAPHTAVPSTHRHDCAQMAPRTVCSAPATTDGKKSASTPRRKGDATSYRRDNGLNGRLPNPARQSMHCART
jgi:hypothetical protein